MVFKIQDFRSRGLALGGARPSLFQVVIQLPTSIPNIGDKISLTCSASEIPASTVASVDVPYFGRKIKLAGDRTFTDWRVTILNDEDFLVRDAFEAWSNGINSLRGNLKSLNDASAPGAGTSSVPGTPYAAEAYVYQYGRAGNVIRSYNFVNIFPTEISTMSVDWNATNTIQDFNVTFAYDYWIPYYGSYNVDDGGAVSGTQQIGAAGNPQ